jgi:hypothetical protein
MKERLGALITELVVAAVRFGRWTRRHCFERLLFAHSGRPLRRRIETQSPNGRRSRRAHQAVWPRRKPRSQSRRDVIVRERVARQFDPKEAVKVKGVRTRSFARKVLGNLAPRAIWPLGSMVAAAWPELWAAHTSGHLLNAEVYRVSDSSAWAATRRWP